MSYGGNRRGRTDSCCSLCCRGLTWKTTRVDAHRTGTHEGHGNGDRGGGVGGDSSSGTSGGGGDEDDGGGGSGTVCSGSGSGRPAARRSGTRTPAEQVNTATVLRLQPVWRRVRYNNALCYVSNNMYLLYILLPATFCLPSTLWPVSSTGGLVFIFF